MYRLHRRFMNFNKLMGISHTDDEAAVGADLSRPPPIYRPRGNPQHIPVHFLKLIIGPFSSITREHREPGIDTTKREQTARHRIIGQRNPQKEKGLKNRSLHEGVGKAMTLKLST